MNPWYLLAAGFKSECNTLAEKITQYDSAPDTCPANSYSCVNKAEFLRNLHFTKYKGIPSVLKL